MQPIPADTASTREAALREILEVISQSRDDERPVFDAVLRNAVRLCGACGAGLLLGRKEGPHLTLAALYDAPDTPAEDLDAIMAEVNGLPMWMDPAAHVAARAICAGEVVQIEDLTQSQSYLSGEPTFRVMVEKQGLRSILSVPLFDATGALGAINLHRREVRPFAADEIELLRGFAVQAVIAIENARQFRELQKRLEREKASAEILAIISVFRDDEDPVFDGILQSASRLCGAESATLMLVDEARTQTLFRRHHGRRFRLDREGQSWSLDCGHPQTEAARTGRIVHVADLKDTALYSEGDPVRVALVDEYGARTVLAVPMLRGELPIGVIILRRMDVARPFSAGDIRLVETFAAQAVIAIENARQFRELQTRLAREAATREILEIISQNPDDVLPVLQVIVRNAARLCETPDVGLHIVNDARTHIRLACISDASFGVFPVGQEFDLDAPYQTATAIREARVIHNADIADDPLYRAGDPVRVRLVDVDGVRSRLSVPLLKNGVAFGCINLNRHEVRPFTPDETQLVETFAAQAVIAIENVRQFKALEALNAELGDRVKAQVGEIERMGRLKRFLPAAVADAVISSGSERMLSSHRSLLGVLFCDIRGFTAFCETAEPEETIEVLQTYHEEMGRLIEAHGAGVDHRMGDGIMVLFNDPLPCEDPAGDAVRLAVAMRARMVELCVKWKRLGHRLGFGVGVALGYATVGMVGAGGRTDYTASGTAINLASRLCDEAQDGEILLSPRARLAVEDDFAVAPRGEIAFKGIREPVEVFRLVG